jgi:drug/metabolite transporter (DMT)-like permease
MLYGLTSAPAASVSLWLNLEPVATTALAWAFFREHVQPRTWLAAALVFAASVVLAAPAGLGLGAAGAWVGLACLCWGLDNNLTALIDRLTPAQTTFVKGLVAGTLNLILGLALEDRLAGMGTVLSALAVGLSSYGLSLVLYIGAAQQLGASRSQMIFASAPFWGVLLAWGVLLEPPTAVQGLAGVLMLLALAVLNSERHGHEHRHVPTTHTHAHRHDDGHHEHAHAGLSPSTWHSHEHTHGTMTHAHPHHPDLHHRHEH